MNDNHLAALQPMARVIAQQLARRPEYLITHPAELKLFHAVSDEELRRFAHEHEWRVVRRIGGRQIEFYNDAAARRTAIHAGLLPPNSSSDSLGD